MRQVTLRYPNSNVKLHAIVVIVTFTVQPDEKHVERVEVITKFLPAKPVKIVDIISIEEAEKEIMAFLYNKSMPITMDVSEGIASMKTFNKKHNPQFEDRLIDSMGGDFDPWIEKLD